MAVVENPFDESSRKVPGGSIPGLPAHPAFTLTDPDPLLLPVVVAVPHAGRSYPADLSAQMRYPAAASLRLEDRMVDSVGEAVARATGSVLLVAHAPRAMIDLNRAPDDIDWEMITGGNPAGAQRHAAGRRARNGLGLIPRRLPAMGEIWRRPMAPADLTTRIEQVHKPYHGALSTTLERLRDLWGAALLIDLHSMPPLGAQQGGDRGADVVVGDRFGAACGGSLAAATCDYLTASGLAVAHNRPYAGGYVLDRHAAPARGIHALQLELCRTIYLDADLRETGPGLGGVITTLTGLVRFLAAELAGDQRLPQAAE
ncbi:N-formylglutamate amidohydrolase [Altererythrobacter xixiisoli]|uniref:N-formylglutamate amidohydrolase n=1 Tax=Croceibacterium xixiisoli TaxID=1476466 RepID=A0A6I4TUW8_9SPHN|nr:N-formylglutamate amidohydrolase [Croceibacterium xixiisoli]MXO98990.1 N-formylglutamate amidohydrolase [Croceibacterium xixiisoli]